MYYIKIAIVIIISGLLPVMHIPYLRADFFLCIALANAFCDKDKYRCVILSAVLGVISAAFSGGYMLFYIAMYMLPTLFITRFLYTSTKLDVIWGALICAIVSCISYGALYAITGVGSWLHMCMLNVAFFAVLYFVIFRLLNPRKRKYRITVQ